MSNKHKHLAALPLGGVGIIGTNMMVYDCDGDLIVVDAGISFPDDTCPGTDVIMPDTRFLREHAKSIKAVFITHAHEDHIGGVGYMWDDFGGAPVYASPLSQMVITGKLQELGIQPKKGQLKTVTTREQYQVGNFSVEFVPVSHSVPEAFALAIRTKYGTIVHTGDYKFDDAAPFGQKTDEERLAEIGKEGVLAVFGDSTNVLNPNSTGSEAPVLEHLTKLLNEAKGRVFFAAFASHFGRTFEVAKVAAKQGRKICFLGRTINKFITHSKALGYWPKELNNWVIDAEEAAGLPAEKVFVFASGTQGEPASSLTRLSQGADVRGLKIRQGDTVIMSSKMIPGNEKGILAVINGFALLNANIISEITDKKTHVSGHPGAPDVKRMYSLLKPTFVIPVHGEPIMFKGHAELARAEGYTPVMLKNGHKLVLAEPMQDPKEAKADAKVEAKAEGAKEAKEAKQPKAFRPYITKHSYPHGFNYVDGLNILENDPLIIKERRKLSYDGVVVAALAIRTTTGEWLGEISLNTRGLMDEVIQADILKDGIGKTTQALEAVFQDGRINDRQRANEVIQQTLRRHFKHQRGKQPTCIVTFVDV
ncbi:MAG: ribonuclease J [Blastochloris viridis]|uniref:Ribonuclease J n=1 Tax=Blastochloris viridis TaxID=1079 RepID=A0A6N4R8G0_BLAVI|nr:MAG: ribonuclease J [Blastochloris viridis]